MYKALALSVLVIFWVSTNQLCGAPSKVDRNSNLNSYRSATRKIQTSSRLRSVFDKRFKSLPASTQESLLHLIEKRNLSKLADNPQFTRPPKIKTSPEELNHSSLGILTGLFFSDQCKVYHLYDGIHKELKTWYIWDVLVFKAPSDARLDPMRLYVKNTKTMHTSTRITVNLVAPRGYRGRHGFSFKNFKSEAYDWEIFRDYFGADEVEFPNGQRRPAADAWYNVTYKNSGSSGNCYGMSMRSIRIRKKDWIGTHSNWWEDHQADRVWDYPNTREVIESIAWDHGGQYSAQTIALINDRFNYQDHQEAFDLIERKVARNIPDNQPILAMWSDDGGHAVVAYKTLIQGNNQKIYLWDCNIPYHPLISGNTGSIAVVNKATKSFDYGYSKMIAFTFDELNPDNPTLPANAIRDGNTLYGDTTIITCDTNGAMKQITDERGRTLLGPDGRMNTNSKTRIPNSMLFLPMSGRKRTISGRNRIRISKKVTTAELPMYVFNKSKGKNLVIDFASPKDVQIRSFSRGTVNEIVASRGRFALANILKPQQSVDINNPDSMRPKILKIIKTNRDGSENVFSLTPKGHLPRKTLKVAMNKQGNGLTITNRGQRSLNINIASKKYSTKGLMKLRPTKTLEIPGGKKLSSN